MRPSTRLVLAGILIGLVFVSGVHYDTAESDHWPYPDTADLKTTPDQHAGEQVFLFGTVEQLDEDAGTARISVESDAGPFTVDVGEFDTQRDVQPGGVVQVVGEFQPGDAVTAENVRVVNPAGSSNLYKYAVSLVAAVLILVLFFRDWRVNIRSLSFEAR